MVFLVTIFISQKTNVLSGIHLSTLKYNVCSTKLETKVWRLHRILVKNISLNLFLINKYAVNNF